MLAQEIFLSPDLEGKSLNNQQWQGYPSGDFCRLFQRERVGAAEQRQRERSEDQHDPAVQSLRGPQGEPIQPEAVLGFLETRFDGPAPCSLLATTSPGSSWEATEKKLRSPRSTRARVRGSQGQLAR